MLAAIRYKSPKFEPISNLWVSALKMVGLVEFFELIRQLIVFGLLAMAHRPVPHVLVQEVVQIFFPA